MQRLEVSGAVRPIYGSLGVKRSSSLGKKYQIKLHNPHLATFHTKHKILIKGKAVPLQAWTGPERS